MTPQDRSKVIEEEQLRHRVRLDLEPHKSLLTKVLGPIVKFFNAPFVLWFGTAIVLGIWYSDYKKHSESELSHRNEALAIDRELRSRFLLFNERLKNFKQSYNEESKRNLNPKGADFHEFDFGYWNGMHGRLYDADHPEVPTSPALNDMPVSYLLNKLHDNLPGKEKKGDRAESAARLWDRSCLLVRVSTDRWNQDTDDPRLKDSPRKLQEYYDEIGKMLDEFREVLDRPEFSDWVTKEAPSANPPSSNITR